MTAASNSEYPPRTIETRGAEIVHTPRGRVAHVLPPYTPEGHISSALCGLYAWSRSDWLGFGSWQEWEKGRRMPLCSRCYAAIKADALFGYEATS